MVNPCRSNRSGFRSRTPARGYRAGVLLLVLGACGGATDPSGEPGVGVPNSGTIALTAGRMMFTAVATRDQTFELYDRWGVGAAPLSTDPAYSFSGLFFIRWTKETPPPTGARDSTCVEVEYWMPSMAMPDRNAQAYHWLAGSSVPCRPVVCELTVSGLAGKPGDPVIGRFSVKSLIRDETNCGDSVDIAGNFNVPFPSP
jgi:hypothetical protein